jgi:hypothetical protein
LSVARKLGLDDVLFARSNAMIINALAGHNCLTRQELKAILAEAGIVIDAFSAWLILSRIKSLMD